MDPIDPAQPSSRLLPDSYFLSMRLLADYIPDTIFIDLLLERDTGVFLNFHLQN